jgi:hypothetical protein
MKAETIPALVAFLALTACTEPDTTDKAPVPDQAHTQAAQAPAVEVSTEGGVTRYNTPGNLQSAFDIGCIDLAQVKNVYSPADLFKGSAACFQSGDGGRGVNLFAMAMAYGRFDIARVADTTAHQGIEMLKMSTFEPFSDEDKALISEGIQAMSNDPEAWSGFCTQLRALGPPAYRPDYMIQHGLRGAGEGDNGLVADFDSAAAWQTVDKYMRCSGGADSGTNGDAPTQASAAERQLAQLVRDAPSLAAVTKIVVAEYFLSQGNWPNSNEQAGVDNSTLNPTISIGPNGVITIRFEEPEELAGKSIVLTPRAGGSGDYVEWRCSSADIPPALRQSNCP